MGGGGDLLVGKFLVQTVQASAEISFLILHDLNLGQSGAEAVVLPVVVLV